MDCYGDELRSQKLSHPLIIALFAGASMMVLALTTIIVAPISWPVLGEQAAEYGN